MGHFDTWLALFPGRPVFFLPQEIGKVKIWAPAKFTTRRPEAAANEKEGGEVTISTNLRKSAPPFKHIIANAGK